MRFLLLGQRIISLDHVALAEWEPVRHHDADGNTVERRDLILTLALPSPADVGVSDWSVEARAINFGHGDEARALWSTLTSIAERIA